MKKLTLLALLTAMGMTSQLAASANPSDPPVEFSMQVALAALPTSAMALNKISEFAITEPDPNLQSCVVNWLEMRADINCLISRIEKIRERSKEDEFLNDIIQRHASLKAIPAKYDHQFQKVMQYAGPESDRTLALKGMLVVIKKELGWNYWENYFTKFPTEVLSMVSEYATSAELQEFAAKSKAGKICEEEARRREERNQVLHIRLLAEELTADGVRGLNCIGRPIGFHFSSIDPNAVRNLCQLTNLQELNLSRLQLDVPTIEALIIALPELRNLQKFNIARNNLGAAGTRLIRALQTLPLQVLNIAFIGTDDTAAETLNDVLRKMLYLQELSMGSNMDDSRDMLFDVVVSLPGISTLKVVNIGYDMGPRFEIMRELIDILRYWGSPKLNIAQPGLNENIARNFITQHSEVTSPSPYSTAKKLIEIFDRKVKVIDIEDI